MQDDFNGEGECCKSPSILPVSNAENEVIRAIPAEVAVPLKFSAFGGTRGFQVYRSTPPWERLSASHPHLLVCIHASIQESQVIGSASLILLLFHSLGP